jgi:hypothetical protein
MKSTLSEKRTILEAVGLDNLLSRLCNASALNLIEQQ